MKKFFSLVLALVMALSLTTVAFGATPAEELQTAINAATGNAVVTLTADIDGDVLVTQKDGVNLTIDGAGHTFSGTLKINGDGRHSGAETLTIKNIKFKTDASALDFIEANQKHNGKYNYAHNVTIENCTFTATYEGDDLGVVAARFRQANNIKMIDCTVVGMHSAMWATGCTKVVVEGLTVTECLNGISVGTSQDVTVADSVIETTSDDGYGIRADGSGDYALTVEDCTVEAFAPVLVREATNDDYEVVMNGDNDLTATNDDGYAVAFTQAKDYNANTPIVEPTASPSFVNSGSAVNTNAVAAGSGVANNGATSGVFAKGTWKGAVLQKNVTVNYFKAVDNKVDKKTGAYEKDGNIAYYMIDGVVTMYAEVNSLAKADMVIYTDAACKNAYMYLAVVDPVYYGDGVKTTNFGTACGQYSNDETDGFDDEATYYTAFNTLYVGVEAGAAYQEQLLVNGELVGVNVANIPVNAHKAVYTRDAKSEITSIKCSACGLAAVEAANYAVLPVNPVMVNEQVAPLWYWPAVATTPSTDKVTSAETFDAGIAMYVGMSVMAAAGSAVVLKKKD